MESSPKTHMSKLIHIQDKFQLLLLIEPTKLLSQFWYGIGASTTSFLIFIYAEKLEECTTSLISRDPILGKCLFIFTRRRPTLLLYEHKLLFKWWFSTHFIAYISVFFCAYIYIF